MNTSTLFTNFNYSIVPVSHLGNKKIHPGKKTEKNLVDVAINFEQENFRLEGNWQYMMAANKHAEKEWFNCHNERVSIEASIFPGLAIDLSDDSNDGMVFVIEGLIKDNENTDSCSGLLVLDKMYSNEETTGSQWDISLYLYDTAHDDCEIAFRFPVQARKTQDLLN